MHTVKPAQRIVNKTLNPPWWVLACIQLFSAWQMGVVYYASNSLSVFPHPPADFFIPDATALIAAGYLVGALLSGLFAQRIVLLGRITLGASLLCSAALLLPLSGVALSVLFAVTVFACVVMIGVSAALGVCLYSPAAALLDGLLTALCAAAGVAAVQGGWFPLQGRSIILLSVLLQLGSLAGLFRLPGRTAVFFPRRGAKGAFTRPPAILLPGLVLFGAAVCLGTLFSTAMAESLAFGVIWLYAGSALSACVFLLLSRRRPTDPMRLISLFLAVTALGFLLWLLPFPALRPLGLALQGCGVTICCLTWFLGGMLFLRWPSRLIAPTALLLALVTVLLHSLILTLLRDDTALLYSVCAVLAVALLLLYLSLEPYLTAAWNWSLPDAAASFAPASSSAPDAAWFSTLTPREREVVELIAQGYSTAAIAQALFLSAQTVKSYCKSIHRKADVHSRVELIAKYNRLHSH